MLRSSNRCVLSALCLLLVFAAGPTGAPSVAGSSIRFSLAEVNYPASSWAMGIVVPEGAPLEGGGSLRWASVANLTALVRLPAISRPDMPVYAVLSVMTTDGAVLQVAAGIYSDSLHWLVYADLVTNVASVPPTYQQVLNSSGPQMSPNASISLSIFRSSAGLWNLRVNEIGTGSPTERSFPTGIAPRLKAGDQEVFAVESYSRSQTTFQRMGNLTLTALLIDGRRASGGFYLYSNWGSNHQPLFVVGSAGSNPPVFISLQNGADGSFVWTYANQWGSDGSVYPSTSETALLVALLAVSLVVVVFAFALLRLAERHKKTGQGQAQGKSRTV